MLLHDGGCDVAHVGDSRAFIIRSGQIYPLTRDHSMVQAMIDAGFLTEEQAIGHPDANKITRALGMKPDVEVEVRPEPMELFAGDLLLTTSDGLTDLALNKDILGATKQSLASGGLEHACQQLVRMANDRGGHDNITVQLVRITMTARGKTKSGQTRAPGPTTTVPEEPLAAVPAATTSQSGLAAPPTIGSADTVVQHRGRLETIPMQPASTAHDGTSRTSNASIGAPDGLPLPPNQGAVNATLSSSLDAPPAGLAGYRLDGVAGLHLPPPSTRFVSPTPPGVQPTPPLGSQRGAAGQGYGMAPSYVGVTSVDSSARGHGGSILFLVLAVSFVIAAVIMLIVWVLFLR
jgi:protein phosphatase